MPHNLVISHELLHQRDIEPISFYFKRKSIIQYTRTISLPASEMSGSIVHIYGAISSLTLVARQ